MVVWKSSPNGKSEPISRRNNSRLRNLNGSELTFVSCQVQSSGGWEGLQKRSCTLHYKVCQFWTRLKLSDHKIFCDTGRIFLPTQHMHTLAVSFVMGVAQWIWFKSTPLHCDLGRRGGAGKSERCCQSWPEHWPCHGPTFSPLFLSLSAAPLMVFLVYELQRFPYCLSVCFGCHFFLRTST